MAEQTTKRRSKDSVFVSLFTDKNYVLQLYQELYPDDRDVTVDDISIKTLEAVMVNTLYNDLGFVVKDRFVVLVEAQSAWCPNIALRMMFYLSETYRRYLEETEQSEHSSGLVKLPKPDLYVVYSGKRNVPEEVSLNETFFGGGSPVDVRVKVLHRIDETICGQYVGFCRVFDEQREIYSNKLECIRETIRISVECGYLAGYLKQHEGEAATMMSELFDEEYLRKRYEIAERRMAREEGIDIGMSRGVFSTLAGLVKKGILTLSQAAEEANVSVAEFEAQTGLKA